MSDLKSKLIRLGYQDPSLRNHLRPVLDKISSPVDYLSQLGWDKRKKSYQEARGEFDGLSVCVKIETDVDRGYRSGFWRISVGSEEGDLLYPDVQPDEINEHIHDMLQKEKQRAQKEDQELFSQNPDVNWWRQQAKKNKIAVDRLSDREVRSIVLDVQDEIKAGDPGRLKRQYRKDVFSSDPKEEFHAFAGLYLAGKMS